MTNPRSPRRRLALLGAAAALLATSPALAATLQQQSFNRWKIQDKCIADSVKAHPDHDAAALRLRDASVDKCLSDHGLPPRDHLAPDPDPPPPAPAAPQ